MAVSMQQVCQLLSITDAPPRLALKKRRQGRPQPVQQLTTLQQRLSCIPGALASRFLGGIALVQVWTLCHEEQSAQTSKSGGIFRTQRLGAALSDPGLARFRQDCCEAGVAQHLAGMLATTWACGALAIVQKLSVMPSSLHPVNKLLSGGVADTVSELAYIPVYDLRNPAAGVVACLEVLVSAATDSTFIANIITTAADLLSGYQLALCKPHTAAVPHATPAAAAVAAQPAFGPSDDSGGASPAAGGRAARMSATDSGSSVDSCPSPGTPEAIAPMLARPSMVRVGTRRSLDQPQQMDST